MEKGFDSTRFSWVFSRPNSGLLHAQHWLACSDITAVFVSCFPRNGVDSSAVEFFDGLLPQAADLRLDNDCANAAVH